MSYSDDGGKIMKIILFTLPTCKYCIPAKELLNDRKDIKIIDLESHEELAIKYGIKSVPTLIEERCNEFKSYVGLDQIQEFIKKNTYSKPCCKDN